MKFASYTAPSRPPHCFPVLRASPVLSLRQDRPPVWLSTPNLQPRWCRTLFLQSTTTSRPTRQLDSPSNTKESVCLAFGAQGLWISAGETLETFSRPVAGRLIISAVSSVLPTHRSEPGRPPSVLHPLPPQLPAKSPGAGLFRAHLRYCRLYRPVSFSSSSLDGGSSTSASSPPKSPNHRQERSQGESKVPRLLIPALPTITQCSPSCCFLSHLAALLWVSGTPSSYLCDATDKPACGDTRERAGVTAHQDSRGCPLQPTFETNACTLPYSGRPFYQAWW